MNPAAPYFVLVVRDGADIADRYPPGVYVVRVSGGSYRSPAMWDVICRMWDARGEAPEPGLVTRAQQVAAKLAGAHVLYETVAVVEFGPNVPTE